GGTYASGASATVWATAGTGYKFANWTKNGSVVSTSATYSFRVRNDTTLQANFVPVPVQYSVGVNASPSAGGTVSGGGTYAAGSSVTVTAGANRGYRFANWTANGSVVSTSASYTFSLNGNVALVANFTPFPVQYTVGVNPSPSAGGTVSGGGTYASGS